MRKAQHNDAPALRSPRSNFDRFSLRFPNEMKFEFINIDKFQCVSQTRVNCRWRGSEVPICVSTVCCAPPSHSGAQTNPIRHSASTTYTHTRLPRHGNISPLSANLLMTATSDFPFAYLEPRCQWSRLPGCSRVQHAGYKPMSKSTRAHPSEPLVKEMACLCQPWKRICFVCRIRFVSFRLHPSAPSAMSAAVLSGVEIIPLLQQNISVITLSLHFGSSGTSVLARWSLLVSPDPCNRC